MPKIASLGALSSRGFGEFAQQTSATYIEDVFSTYLYTGNGTTQTITNGIDFSGKGGLVWIKGRNLGLPNYLIDTVRGGNNILISNSTNAQSVQANPSVVFNSNGFLVDDAPGAAVNYAGSPLTTYASWAFRKQPKFFDVVTWTGDGTNNRVINHNLGSIPGMIVIKSSSAASNWNIYHRSIPTDIIFLERTDAAVNGGGFYVTATTATTFTIGRPAGGNGTGSTYVAYLFAHNAGGFGADGSQNVISCGSYTGNGSNSGPSINLGWEPQWVMIKRTDTSGNWWMMDVMRGMSQTDSLDLQANASTGDLTDSVSYARPLAAGFSPGTSYSGVNASGGTYIYMAIRRGPMRTPTDATKVYAPVAYTATNVDGRLISSGFPVDSAIIDPRNGYSTPGGPNWFSRLTGNGYFLQTAQTAAELNGNSNSNGIMGQDGITVSRNGTNVWSNVGSNTYISWFLARAPGFFDVVCDTGTGAAHTINHNLGVVPELIIRKARSSGQSWVVQFNAIGWQQYMYLNATDQAYYPSGDPNSYWGSAPTSTNFGVGTANVANLSGATFVTYLFASCPGVSKVGTYTGTGATQTISCGFTGGARFVLIKRTDYTGDWYVWDTARGMVSGTDPSLLLNSTNAEVNANSIYTTTGGFQIVSTANGINGSGYSYVYLAIA